MTTPQTQSKYHNNDFVLFNSVAQPFPEPRTINQALKHPQWRQAMQSEHEALMRNHTWSTAPNSNQMELWIN